jgi:4'-phosphopantetheinyl transferase EntD
MSSASALVLTRGPLTRLLGEAPVKVAEMDPRLASPGVDLFEEEAQAIANAVDSRRRQFTAGRWLARHAWRELGHDPAPLINDANRVPIWPDGLVGTITHTNIWCAAAVARSSDVVGIGADVEAATPLERGLWDRVCRPEERAFLHAQPEPLAGLLAKALFSAKESIYKALYPRIRAFLDFQGMLIELSPAGDGWTWQAELQVPWGGLAPGQRLSPGRLHIDASLIVTSVVLARWPSEPPKDLDQLPDAGAALKGDPALGG